MLKLNNDYYEIYFVFHHYHLVFLNIYLLNLHFVATLVHQNL